MVFCLMACWVCGQAAAGDVTRVCISLAGDCVLGGEEETRGDERSFDSVMAKKGLSWPFSGLGQLFCADDITLVNLECVLKDGAGDMASGRLYNFRGEAAYADILRLGGVEAVNIANNHFIDYGEKGRESTKRALQAAEIGYAGYAELWVKEVRGKKIGFGGIRETVYRQDRTVMAGDIQKLKEMGCDAIVYSCHFGEEYSRTHSSLQTKMAREAIDLGANLVVGHHPHVVQGVEAYHGGMILYSLGNFIFGGNLDLTEFDGCAAQAEFVWKGEQLAGTRLLLIPVLTTGSAPENDFRPVIAEGTDKARIFGKMQADSEMIVQESMYVPK